MNQKQAVNLGYQQVNAAGTTAAFSPAPVADRQGLKPRFVLINAEAQGLRWRDDGTDPTSAVGMLVPSGTTFEYYGNVSQLRVINAAAGAIANFSFYA